MKLPARFFIAAFQHLLLQSPHRAAATWVQLRIPASDRAWLMGRGTERSWSAMGALTPYPPSRAARRGRHCSSRASSASVGLLAAHPCRLAFLLWVPASLRRLFQPLHQSIEKVLGPSARDTGRNLQGTHATSHWPSSPLSSRLPSDMRSKLHRLCFRPGGE